MWVSFSFQYEFWNYKFCSIYIWHREGSWGFLFDDYGRYISNFRFDNAWKSYVCSGLDFSIFAIRDNEYFFSNGFLGDWKDWCLTITIVMFKFHIGLCLEILSFFQFWFLKSVDHEYFSCEFCFFSEQILELQILQYLDFRQGRFTRFTWLKRCCLLITVVTFKFFNFQFPYHEYFTCEFLFLFSPNFENTNFPGFRFDTEKVLKLSCLIDKMLLDDHKSHCSCTWCFHQ